MKKRILALILVTLTLCMFCLPAGAAINQSNYSQLMKFKGNSTVYNAVQLCSSSSNARTGTLRVVKTFTIPGSSYTIPAGTVFNYSINSIKQGGKITFTYKSGADTSVCWYFKSGNPLNKFTGTISSYSYSWTGCLFGIKKISLTPYGTFGGSYFQY